MDCAEIRSNLQQEVAAKPAKKNKTTTVIDFDALIQFLIEQSTAGEKTHELFNKNSKT